MSDPVEDIIRSALTDAGIEFVDERDARTLGLDFYLPKEGVRIEVKQFHSDRISEQMSRAPNVIAIQGITSALLFASFVRRDHHCGAATEEMVRAADARIGSDSVHIAEIEKGLALAKESRDFWRRISRDERDKFIDAEQALADAKRLLEVFAPPQLAGFEEALFGDFPDDKPVKLTFPLGEIRRVREFLRQRRYRGGEPDANPYVA